MKVIIDDGSESEVGSGDVVTIPPGHDAESVSDEPYVSSLHGRSVPRGDFGQLAQGHADHRLLAL